MAGLQKVRELTVDTMIPRNFSQNEVDLKTYYFYQGDINSAKFLLNITHEGTEQDLSTATKVQIAFLKPDGKRVFQDCSNVNPTKGKYYVVLNTQSITTVGNVVAQIRITFPDTVVETTKFVFSVAESIMSDEAVESSDEFPAIQKAIEAGEKLEGKDIDGIIAAGAKADEALSKSTENERQIGILSNNVGSKAEKNYVDEELTKKVNQADLNKKADMSYVDTKVASVASGSPKGTYATLSALQTAFPTGNTNIYLVTADGKWYYWNGSAWAAGGVYQSTGIGNISLTNDKFANKAVSIDKTNFLAVASNNLFDKDNVIPNSSISASTGNPISSANNNLSMFLPVATNSNYTLYGVARIAFYTSDYTFISTQLLTDVQTTVTSPGNATYVRLIVGNVNLNIAQMNAGDSRLAYDNYKIKVNNVVVEGSSIQNLMVSYAQTDFVTISSNLFNKDVFLDKTSFDNSNGSLIVSEPHRLSGFIEVKPTQSYIGNFVMKYAAYDKDKNYIKQIYPVTMTSPIVTPINTKYLRCVYNTEDVGVVSMQLNEGTTLLSYEPYYVNIKGVKVSNVSEQTPLKTEHYKPSEIPYGWYESPVVDGYEAIDHYSDNISINDIYNAYDVLVAAYPEYITKTVLGNDSTGAHPIHKYEFKPVEVSSSRFSKKLPKLIITSGVHGEEKSSVVGLRNFINDMVNNWVDNPLLEFIRYNVHLVIVPIVNPYGFTKKTRKNGNGVDINRNCSFRWETSDSSDPTNARYKGPSPFSESESQYLRNIINDNPDAIAYYDYHMNGTSGAEYETMFWHYIEAFNDSHGFEELNIISKYDISKLTREAHKKFSIPTNSGFIGYISYNGINATSAGYAYSQGIPAMTVECTRKMVGETKVYSPNTLRLCTEFIGNVVLTTLREFLK